MIGKETKHKVMLCLLSPPRGNHTPLHFVTTCEQKFATPILYAIDNLKTYDVFSTYT